MTLAITNNCLVVDSNTSIALPLAAIKLDTKNVIQSKDGKVYIIDYSVVTSPVVVSNADLYSWFQTNCTV